METEFRKIPYMCIFHIRILISMGKDFDRVPDVKVLQVGSI